VFLYKLNRPVVYTVVPMLVMLAVSVWALIVLIVGFVTAPEQPWRWTLTGTTIALLLLAFWLIAEALLSLRLQRGGLGEDDETPPIEPSHDREVDAAHLG
jgi:carbon starvation protein